MACPGAPSFDEPAGGCPLPLAQQAVALGFVGATLFIVAGGLALFWLQRHDPLVSKRDWVSTLCLAGVTLLTQLSVYVGMSAPCWSYFAMNYTLSAIIPGLMMCRFFGIYARHLRQDTLQRTARGSIIRLSFVALNIPEPLATTVNLRTPPAPSFGDFAENEGPKGGPRTTGCDPSIDPVPPRQTRLDAYASWLGRHLLLFGIDRPRRGILGLLLTCIPWLAYAVVRFAASPTHALGSSGCQWDIVDVSMVVVCTGLTLPTAIPAVMRIAQVPDRLLLRYDGVAQLAIWPPLIAWLLTDLSLSPGSHTALHGIYGPLTGCLLTFITSVWVPALMASCRRSPRTILPRRGDAVTNACLAMRHAAETMPASDPLAQTVSGTDPQILAHYAVDLDDPMGRTAGVDLHSADTTCIVSARQHSEIFEAALGSESAQMVDLSSSDMLALMTAAHRFVHPTPSTTEVIATLTRQAAEIGRSSDSRDVAIFCATLFAMEPGRVLLFETLRLDLSAEFLGFLVDCEDLRFIAEEWLSRVVSDAPLQKVSVSATDCPWSQFYAALHAIEQQYVDLLAPHYISMSGNASCILRQSTRDLGQLLDPAGQDEEGAETAAAAIAERAMVAIAYAEMDVFEMVIDPLRRRMRNVPGLFDSWAAATLKELRVPQRSSEEAARTNTAALETVTTMR